MDVQVHVFAAPADKFFVNSFIVETPSALVVVDTQFLTSTAAALSAQVAALAKPLAAILVTHPHPDHYNGLPRLLADHGPVPVYANAPTIAGIRATQAEKRAAWTPVYGGDYPTADALPDHEVGPDAVLELGGVAFHLIDLGPGECADNSMIHLPQADVLIASDLIYNGCHPWLAEHRTGAWLRQLDEVEARFAATPRIYAGHGVAGGPELFGDIRRYIADFRACVGEQAEGGALSASALAAVVAQTVDGRAGWPLEALVEMNAKAVAEELAAG